MERPLRILLLEDSQYDAELILRELRKGLVFDSMVVDTKDAFEKAITEFKPDAVLSDHSLPSFDSFQALAIVKSLNKWLPFILVTGTVSEEFAAQCIKEGADDYLLKGKLARLNMSIKNSIAKRRAEQEREQYIEKILETNGELNMYIYKSTHDLRGPLCSIIGLSELALKEKAENVWTYMTMISESARKLDAVLISLIETMSIRNAEVKAQEVRLSTVIEKVLAKLTSVNGFENVHVHVEMDNNYKLVTDEKILSPILRNVIDNAIRYKNINQSDSRVRITVHPNSNGMMIEISDNGPGIAPEMREKIFDMFYKGNLSSAGCGLGLYLARNGAEKLGGYLHVNSELNIGSTFTLELPDLRKSNS